MQVKLSVAAIAAVLLLPACAVMNPSPIHTDDAPAAIGPYSQAVVLGDLVFCSGQISLHPKTGEMVGDTAATQAKQALENLVAVLAAAGSSVEKVARTTVYLVDMGDYAAVNDVYDDYFSGSKPARAAVAVKALPKGALVEISCIAGR